MHIMLLPLASANSPQVTGSQLLKPGGLIKMTFLVALCLRTRPYKTVRLLVAVKEGPPSYIRGQQDTTRRYPTEIPAAREAGFPSNPY